LIASYFFINSTINATSDWMEATRNGAPEFTLIEPFIWEYSSTISVLLLLPLLAMFWQRSPLKLSNIKSQLGKKLLASLLFSILHVSIMVVLREVVYWTIGGHYDFGSILREFIYEYRKDAMSYGLFLVFYQLYQYIYGRLKGEANLIEAESEPQSSSNVPGHLLDKKARQRIFSESGQY
jgi:hypothetical protein